MSILLWAIDKFELWDQYKTLLTKVENTSYKFHHYKFLELHMTNGLSCENKRGSTFDKLKKILVNEP
jgi:hypothetical protein